MRLNAVLQWCVDDAGVSRYNPAKTIKRQDKHADGHVDAIEHEDLYNTLLELRALKRRWLGTRLGIEFCMRTACDPEKWPMQDGTM